MSYALLRGGSGIQWPCTAEAPHGTERLYTDGSFNTDADICENYGYDLVTGAAYTEKDRQALDPDRRAILRAAAYQPPDEAPDAAYPLAFTSGRTLYHFHTRTKTRRAPQLNRAAPGPWVELNASDAERLGINEGDLVRVESRRGRIDVPARITAIRPGTVFAPFHYGYFDEPSDSGPNGMPHAANEVTLTEWDPVSKQPFFKGGAVRVTKLADSGGIPAPAPTIGAPAPLVAASAVPPTHGGSAAEASSTVEEV
jgi:anaerobic selenocysteine-containing dehydrogenase